MRGDVFLDQQGESAVRQAGAAEADVSLLYESTRSTASVVTGAFTADARANRMAAAGEADGDRWLETDTGLVYYYDSGWHYETGVATGADGARFTPSADDNGALYFATDTLALWEVAAGAWSKLLQIAGTTNQITAGIAGGVLTLSLNASPDVTTSYKVAGTKVVGAQGAAVADADGTLASATSQLNALLARVRAHGLIAP